MVGRRCIQYFLQLLLLRSLRQCKDQQKHNGCCNLLLTPILYWLAWRLQWLRHLVHLYWRCRHLPYYHIVYKPNAYSQYWVFELIVPLSILNCPATQWQLHQMLRSLVLASDLRDVAVVLSDALIQPVQLAEQIADDGVAPTRQLFE